MVEEADFLELIPSMNWSEQDILVLVELRAWINIIDCDLNGILFIGIELQGKLLLAHSNVP